MEQPIRGCNSAFQASDWLWFDETKVYSTCVKKKRHLSYFAILYSLFIFTRHCQVRPCVPLTLPSTHALHPYLHRSRPIFLYDSDSFKWIVLQYFYFTFLIWFPGIDCLTAAAATSAATNNNNVINTKTTYMGTQTTLTISISITERYYLGHQETLFCCFC